jgi:hypothetical protein
VRHVNLRRAARRSMSPVAAPAADQEVTMARTTTNPELKAALRSLAEAVHHTRLALSQQIGRVESLAVEELGRVKDLAVETGRASGRRVQGLLRRSRQRLTRATTAAERSVHQAARAAEGKLQTVDRSVAAAAQAPARAAAPRKSPAKAPAKAPTRKAAARKPRA